MNSNTLQNFVDTNTNTAYKDFILVGAKPVDTSTIVNIAEYYMSQLLETYRTEKKQDIFTSLMFASKSFVIDRENTNNRLDWMVNKDQYADSRPTRENKKRAQQMEVLRLALYELVKAEPKDEYKMVNGKLVDFSWGVILRTKTVQNVLKSNVAEVLNDPENKARAILHTHGLAYVLTVGEYCTIAAACFKLISCTFKKNKQLFRWDSGKKTFNVTAGTVVACGATQLKKYVDFNPDADYDLASVTRFGMAINFYKMHAHSVFKNPMASPSEKKSAEATLMALIRGIAIVTSEIAPEATGLDITTASKLTWNDLMVKSKKQTAFNIIRVMTQMKVALDVAQNIKKSGQGLGIQYTGMVSSEELNSLSNNFGNKFKF